MQRKRTMDTVMSITKEKYTESRNISDGPIFLLWKYYAKLAALATNSYFRIRYFVKKFTIVL